VVISAFFSCLFRLYVEARQIIELDSFLKKGLCDFDCETIIDYIKRRNLDSRFVTETSDCRNPNQNSGNEIHVRV